MRKARILFLILIAGMLTLAACNLPAAGSASKPLKVSVSAPSEYRTGPGQEYAVVGVLDPGQEVEAVGRSSVGNYLLIRDPANPAQLWWLQGEYIIVIGNPASLPISTPPPGGCPTPVDGGPTPVNCAAPVSGPASGGCPTPVNGGPTPVNCATPVSGAASGGCPTPVNGGPTQVNCSTPVPGSASVGGCPTPVGGGPTPVNCTGPVSHPSSGGCPTPVGGGPTPVNCTKPAGRKTPVGGPTARPTPVQ
jgi:hypothetical protein